MNVALVNQSAEGGADDLFGRRREHMEEEIVPRPRGGQHGLEEAQVVFEPDASADLDQVLAPNAAKVGVVNNR